MKANTRGNDSKLRIHAQTTYTLMTPKSPTANPFAKKITLGVISHLLVLDDKVGQRLVLSPEDDSSNEVGQHGTGLVFTVGSCRDREYTIELFEGEKLGLGNEEPNEDKGDNVECCVGTEGTLRGEGSEHSGELIISSVLESKVIKTYSQGKDGRESETDCYGPSHSLFSLSKREDFGRVHEWHWSLSDGVECREQVDEAARSACDRE